MPASAATPPDERSLVSLRTTTHHPLIPHPLISHLSIKLTPPFSITLELIIPLIITIISV